MKKLSLVLALIFVFTCSVLAACGGDDTTSSTPATSSKTESKVESSEASSEAESSSEAASSEDASSEAASSEDASSEAASSEDASSEAASSEDASSEAASSEVESSEDASSEAESSEDESSEDVEVVVENLAAGKTVTYVSGQGMHANYNGNITDGVTMDEVSYDPGKWMGIGTPQKEGEYAWVVLDLGAYCKLDSAKIHIGIDSQAGVGKAWDCTFSYSDDGVAFVGGDEIVCPDTDGVHWVEKDIDSVFCRYIRFKCMPSSWCFFDELEVYGEIVG